MTSVQIDRLHELASAYDSVAEITIDDAAAVDVIEKIAESENPEEVFEDIFGMTVKELNKELNKYNCSEV